MSDDKKSQSIEKFGDEEIPLRNEDDIPELEEEETPPETNIVAPSGAPLDLDKASLKFSIAVPEPRRKDGLTDLSITLTESGTTESLINAGDDKRSSSGSDFPPPARESVSIRTNEDTPSTSEVSPPPLLEDNSESVRAASIPSLSKPVEDSLNNESDAENVSVPVPVFTESSDLRKRSKVRESVGVKFAEESLNNADELEKQYADLMAISLESSVVSHAESADDAGAPPELMDAEASEAESEAESFMDEDKQVQIIDRLSGESNGSYSITPADLYGGSQSVHDDEFEGEDGRNIQSFIISKTFSSENVVVLLNLRRLKDGEWVLDKTIAQGLKPETYGGIVSIDQYDFTEPPSEMLQHEVDECMADEDEDESECQPDEPDQNIMDILKKLEDHVKNVNREIEEARKLMKKGPLCRPCPDTSENNENEFACGTMAFDELPVMEQLKRMAVKFLIEDDGDFCNQNCAETGCVDNISTYDAVTLWLRSVVTDLSDITPFSYFIPGEPGSMDATSAAALLSQSEELLQGARNSGLLDALGLEISSSAPKTVDGESIQNPSGNGSEDIKSDSQNNADVSGYKSIKEDQDNSSDGGTVIEIPLDGINVYDEAAGGVAGNGMGGRPVGSGSPSIAGMGAADVNNTTSDVGVAGRGGKKSKVGTSDTSGNVNDTGSKTAAIVSNTGFDGSTGGAGNNVGESGTSNTAPTVSSGRASRKSVGLAKSDAVSDISKTVSEEVQLPSLEETNTGSLQLNIETPNNLDEFIRDHKT